MYRYTLYREWATSGQSVCFILLNPSTADDRHDDPTVRRCCGFAKRFGGGRLTIVNLSPYRAVRPANLKGIHLPPDIWRENIQAVVNAIRSCDSVIAGWGNNATLLKFEGLSGALYIDRLLKEVGESVRATSQGLLCLGKTKSGFPRHPLYLSYKTELESYYAKHLYYPKRIKPTRSEK